VNKDDKDLGQGRAIARRDFLQGAAITTLASGLAPELAAAANAGFLRSMRPA